MIDSATVNLIRIGPILSVAWRVLSRNMSLTLLTLIAHIPFILIDVFFDEMPLYSYTFWCALLLASVVSAALNGMMVHGVLRAMNGEELDLGDSIARGLAWIVPAFIVSLLGTAIVFLGMLALIVPGLVLSCALAVSIEACVAEGLDPIDSLKRSADLTKGNRMQIFGFNLLLAAAGGIVSGLLGSLIGTFTDDRLASLLFSYILTTPVYAYTAVSYIVLYRFLASSGSACGDDRFSHIFN